MIAKLRQMMERIRVKFKTHQDGELIQFLENIPSSFERDDILFVHGSPRDHVNEYVFPEDTQNSKKIEKLFSMVPHLCFQGHTHVPGVFTTDLRFVRPSDTGAGISIADTSQRMMVNVGSVGQPRDGDSRSCYVVMDDESVTFRRVEYDIERTVREIEAEAELDDFLGYRLREGR